VRLCEDRPRNSRRRTQHDGPRRFCPCMSAPRTARPSATATRDKLVTTAAGDLHERGLTGVQLVISDTHSGLVKAVGTVLQGASWQRCRVHFMRNVLGQGQQGPRRDGRRHRPHDLRPARPEGARTGSAAPGPPRRQPGSPRPARPQQPDRARSCPGRAGPAPTAAVRAPYSAPTATVRAPYSRRPLTCAVCGSSEPPTQEINDSLPRTTRSVCVRPLLFTHGVPLPFGFLVSS
jgi:hypothetical protein